MMASRQQKKVWRYVEEGSLMKLKSYLRKHRDVELNFTRGKRRRGLLHLICTDGDDSLLAVLMTHGADPLLQDRDGDTPLHLALQRALKYGKRDYDDLVVPLCKHCPDSLNKPNNAGITPRELLQGLKFKQGRTSGSGSSRGVDPEQEWREKLFGECQDEVYEAFGQYDDDHLRDDEDEGDFADWAERIRREYEAKRRSRAASHRKDRRQERDKALQEEDRGRRELHARLEREHREYLERAARKQDETQRGKKRRYEERCQAVFLGSSAPPGEPSSNGTLGYADIPWPAPRGSVADMMDVILHGADRSDAAAFRKFLKRQQVLWHPDKFGQRCGGRLEPRDRQRIMDTVTLLSQELNRAAQSLR